MTSAYRRTLLASTLFAGAVLVAHAVHAQDAGTPPQSQDASAPAEASAPVANQTGQTPADTTDTQQAGGADASGGADTRPEKSAAMAIGPVSCCSGSAANENNTADGPL